MALFCKLRRRRGKRGSLLLLLFVFAFYYHFGLFNETLSRVIACSSHPNLVQVQKRVELRNSASQSSLSNMAIDKCVSLSNDNTITPRGTVSIQLLSAYST